MWIKIFDGWHNIDNYEQIYKSEQEDYKGNIMWCIKGAIDFPYDRTLGYSYNKEERDKEFEKLGKQLCSQSQ